MKKIIFLGILIFIVSIGVGYLYSGMFLKQSTKDFRAERLSENIIEDDVPKKHTELQTLEAVADTEKVSPNATFAIKEYFDECNHFNFKYLKLPKEIVNLTRQELEDYYDEYEVEEMESNNVVLSKEINGFCKEHFFIKLGNEHIEVMQLDTDGSFLPYKETNISREYLPPEDIDKLEEGIYVFGSGNIDSVLEDYE